MFQFTTETIINSFDGNLKNITDVMETIGGEDNRRIAKYDDKLLIEKVGTFKKEYIKKITVTAGRAAVNEKIVKFTPNLTGLNDGDVIRLSVYVRQEGRVISTFNNHYPIHVNPYQFEVKYNSSAAKTMENLCATVKEIQRMSDINYFTVTKDGDALTFEATDEYTRFVRIELVKVNLDKGVVGTVLTGYADYSELSTWEAKNPGQNCNKFVCGTIGTGTVSYILYNLRLPTAENYNPFSAFKDEMPIPGTLYSQICMEYCSPDLNGASYSHVGAQNESLTTHIFFVPNDKAKQFAEFIACDTTVEYVKPAKGLTGSRFNGTDKTNNEEKAVAKDSVLLS